MVPCPLISVYFYFRLDIEMGEGKKLSIQCLSMKYGKKIWGLRPKIGPSSTIRFVDLRDELELANKIQLCMLF